jgi:hypothetical protein
MLPHQPVLAFALQGFLAHIEFLAGEIGKFR